MHPNTLKSWFRFALLIACVIACLAACDDGGGSNAGTGGAGAMTGGVGGVSGAMAGMSATGGMGATGGMSGMAGAAGMGATGAPTWNAIFTEIIVAKGCNGGAFCHAGMAGGSLIMNDPDSAHAALVGVPAMGRNLVAGPPECNVSGLTRVVAGNPDMSLFVQKIEGSPACGTAMPPPPAPLLSAAEITQIRTWIMNGAHND